MFNMIERYMNNLKKDDINRFALKNNVNLSEEELNFTYAFVIKNWKMILSNPSSFNLERYKDKFSNENYQKINRLIKEYLTRYQAFL